MTNATCPSAEALRQYQLGDYSQFDGAEIEQHLSHCPSCEQTLAELDSASDSLLRHLPLIAGQGEDESAESPGWLDRLKAGPPMPAEPDSPTGDDDDVPVIEGLDSYELTGILGKGGMGIVYSARHRQLHRSVAVKVVSPKLISASEARQRFEREIRILGGLNHPGIVMATDAGRIGSAAYLVMELIEGADLARLVRHSGPLGIGEACNISRQVALALAAAHEAGATHRDVKPSNVMIDAEGRVKLLDFGLAHLADVSSHTDTSLGQILGTLNYMAPEQADGGPVSSSADLYGLGATLFYLLTGRPPHGSNRPQSLLQQLKSLASDTVPRLCDIRPDVPAELSDLVASLLSQDVAERPPAAHEVAERLTAFAEPTERSLSTLVAELPPAFAPTDLPEPSELVRSLSELIGSPVPTTSALRIRLDETRVDSGSRRAGWGRFSAGVLALLATAALLVWGVVILLETPSGTLRIESQADNVRVEVVGEDRAVRELQIESGANETQLRAGKYRIAIAGGHDSLSLDKNVVMLKRGEQTVARVVQSGAGLVEETAEIAQEARNGFDSEHRGEGEKESDWENLYKGETTSVWQRRFDNETDPAARMEAARALMSLASSLPSEDRVDRIVAIGSELVEDWGGDLAALKPLEVFETLSTLDPEYVREWAELIAFSSQQLALIPGAAVADRLTASTTDDNIATSVFSLMLLHSSWVADKLKSDLESVHTIVEKLKIEKTSNLATTALLLRVFYLESVPNDAPGEFSELRAKTIDEFKVWGKNVIDSGVTEKNVPLVKHWLEHAETLHIEPQTVAEMILALLVYDREAGLGFFTSHSSPNREQIYDTRRYIEPWIPLATKWLKDHREDDESHKAKTAVIQSISYVLRWRKPEDQWDVDETRKLFVEYLRPRYGTAAVADDDRPSRELSVRASSETLLSSIVLCGGDIPDFVVNEPIAKPGVAARLDKVRIRLQQQRDHHDHRTPDEVRSLMSVVPFQILSSYFHADQSWPLGSVPLGIESRSAALGYPTYSLDFVTNREENESRVYPLLLLAIVARHAGISQRLDDRLAVLFELPKGSGEVERSKLSYHIEEFLQGPFVSREITEKYLRRIHERSKSSELTRRVEELYPELREEKLAAARERFESAGDPAAKIDAARELLVAGDTLPLERRFDLLAEVYIAATRVFQDPSSSEFRESPEIQRFEKTFEARVREIFKDTKSNQLANRLVEMAQSDDYAVATAAIRLIEAKISSTGDPEGIIAQGLHSPHFPSLAVPFLKMRFRLHQHKHGFVHGGLNTHENPELYSDIQNVGRQYLDGEFEGAHLEGWMILAKEAGVSPTLIARVLFQQMLTAEDPKNVVQRGFSGYLQSTVRYNATAMTTALGANAEVWPEWIRLADDWLESNIEDGDRKQTAAVLQTLEVVLRCRQENMKWPVEGISKSVTEYLRPYYESGDEQESATAIPLDAEQLLTLIVLAEGGIPDFVRDGQPGDEQVQRQLAMLQGYLGLGELPAGAPASFADGQAELKGLLQKAPYRTVRAIFVGGQLLKNTSLAELLNALAEVGEVQSVGRSRSLRQLRQPSVAPPIDPLLLLAIIAGNWAQTDDVELRQQMTNRISVLLAEVDWFKSFVGNVQSADGNFAAHRMAREMMLATSILPPVEEPADEGQTADEPTPAVIIDNEAPLYQGQPWEVWQKKFDNEVNPVSRLEAAQALVTLAGADADRDVVAVALELGGQLMEAGWGDEAPLTAIHLESNHFLYGRLHGRLHYFNPPRWSRSVYPALEDQWESWIDAIAAQFKHLPAADVAGKLVSAAREKPLFEASLALWVLTEGGVRLQVSRDSAALDAILTRLVRESKIEDESRAEVYANLDRACVMLRGLYLHWCDDEATAEQRELVRADFEELGRRLNEGKISNGGKFVRPWLEIAQKIDADARLSAELVLDRILGDETRVALVENFGSDRLTRNNSIFTYSAQVAEWVREKRGGWFWGKWFDVANQWLADNGFRVPAAAPIAQSLDLIIRTRHPDDDWAIDQTAAMYVDALRSVFDSADDDQQDNDSPGELAVDAETLLAFVVLAGQPVPEFVKGEWPADIDRKRIERLEYLADNNLEWDQYHKQSQAIRGLIQVAPYQTVRTILEGTRDRDEKSSLGLINDASSVNSPNEQPSKYSPPLEPMLLLAILVDLTGKSEDLDDGIADVIDEYEGGNLLRRHIEDAVESSFAVHDIADGYLRAMYSKSKSEELTKQLEKVYPALTPLPAGE